MTQLEEKVNEIIEKAREKEFITEFFANSMPETHAIEASNPD